MKKSEYQKYFTGKKVTQMRIGLLGRGVGDAAFLAECGAEILVVDDAPQSVMQPSVDKLKGYSNITFKFGAYDLADFREADYILKGAGTPLDSPEIAEARKNNIEVKMSTSWFAKIAMDHGVKIVGVTGTRGKSTVTHLIYEILKENNPRVFLGGNVRGVSTLPLLKKLKKDDIVVMELDSWQLQGFGDEGISPNVAVFTTFLPDHLNYYKGDPPDIRAGMKAYFADKSKIYINQKEGDILIAGNQMEKMVGVKNKIVVGLNDLPKNWKLKMPGVHNRYNAALAVAAAKALNVPEKIIKKVAENFAGVPGRLELVRKWKGREIYNDTTSTTPEAGLVALEALGNKKNIILIMGGADKTLDMSKLVEALPKYCKEVIWLPGTGTDKIKNENSKVVNSMKDAVSEAVKLSKKGDAILLSPAFASFGLFKNEFDRGEQFDNLIKKLK